MEETELGRLLGRLESKLDALFSKFDDHRTEVAAQFVDLRKDHSSLMGRVQALELWQANMTGRIAAYSALGGVVTAVALKFLF